MSKAGMLRGESLCKAELSDMFHIQKDDEGPPGHPATIFILQILDGKCNKDGKPVWGRCMRHADPRICPLGALGFYLFLRIKRTQETFEIWDNAQWFDRKLCIDPRNNKSLDVEMSMSHLGKVLHDIGKKLDIFIAQIKHFG